MPGFLKNMHHRELDRLLAVDRLLNLKISKETELMEIVESAAKICNTPIALITLLDADTQYFKLSVGADPLQTSRKDAFCNYVINQEEVLVVPDTTRDSRFKNEPLKNGETEMRFYAGAPLITQDGLKLGSLCVIGHVPHDLTEQQVMMLSILSKQVVHLLEFDYSQQILKEQFLEARKNEIALSSLFESSKSCMMLVDLDLKVLFFNKVLFDFMDQQYQNPIAIGMTVTDLLSDSFLYDFILNFNKARMGERVLEEKLIVHADKKIWWQFNYDPAFDVDGHIIGISYSAADISELRASQTKIDERDQSLEAIALIQSHEIRRPVSSILGLIEIFKLNDYATEKDEILMLEKAANELDSKIHNIIIHASSKNATL
jgi:PAS domain S-box-containing protein